MEVLFYGTVLLMGLQTSEEFPSTLPPGTCEVQVETERFPCIFNYNDYTRAGYTELSFNGSEGRLNDGTVFSNISVAFPYGFSGIVQIIGIQENEYIHSQLDLHHPFLIDKSFSLQITEIPFDLQHTSVRSIRLFNGPLQDPCTDQEIYLKCQNLLENMKMMIKAKSNRVEVEITTKWTDPLKLELHGTGRLCDSTCREADPSCPTNLTIIEWTDPMTEMIFTNLVPSYYCARAVFSVHGHPCCALYTRSVRVNVDEYAQMIPHSEHNFHISSFFYYMFIFLISAIVMTIILYCRTAKRTIRSMSFRSKELRSYEETTQLDKLREVEPSIVDIFLVYPHKDGQFMKLMSSFRDLLRDYSKKVWDPLEDREIENVIANPAKWMQGVLTIPDVKIVLVETIEAIQWLRKDHRTTEIGDLYVPVLSFLHNQPDLIYNYSRLHVVRFEKIRSEKDLLLDLVPQKRYKMPYQLGLLIRDLMNCQETIGTENNSSELKRFYKATEDYQSSHEDVDHSIGIQ